MAVAVFVAVIFAFATTAPWGSFTRPVMDALAAPCAWAIPEIIRTEKNTSEPTNHGFRIIASVCGKTGIDGVGIAVRVLATRNGAELDFLRRRAKSSNLA